MPPHYTSHLGESLVEHICEQCGKRRYITPHEATRGPSGRRFCSERCHQASRVFTPEKFWAQVLKTDGCWLWTGATEHNGYGRLSIGRHTRMQAHRLSYTLLHGPIAEGLCVLHRCDNPACVRPDHLFLGSHADNVRDRVAKGRSARGRTHGALTQPQQWARGDAHWARRHPERVARGNGHVQHLHPEMALRGVNHGRALLTEEQVLALRHAYVTEKVSYRTLGRRFGICASQVANIIQGRSWAHLPRPAAN